MSWLRGGLLVAVALLASGCGQVATPASDPGLTVAPPNQALPTPTGPTFVPPNGPCQVALDATEPPPPPSPTTPEAGPTTTRQQADMPPNHVENRRWRVRKDLSPENFARGVALAEKVRPELAALCDAGNFAQESTRTVFAVAGVPDVFLLGLRTFDGTPAAGVQFTADVADPVLGTACVLGMLMPGSVNISVKGTTGEGSCYEPPSH